MKTQFKVLLPVLSGSLASVVWAGTYNFYFNNSEQGNNSTANPSVTVNDGKGEKNTGVEKVEPEKAEIAQPAPLAASAPEAPVSAVAKADLKPEPPAREFRRWRFIGSGIGINEERGN